jgi:hypothetical protein
MAIDWDAILLGPVMGKFGQVVIYTPRGGSSITITDAVWDEGATETTIVGEEQVTIQRPLLGIRQAALGGVTAAQNDRVQIVASGEVYLVKNPLPDSHGHIRLQLAKVSG